MNLDQQPSSQSRRKFILSAIAASFSAAPAIAETLAGGPIFRNVEAGKIPGKLDGAEQQMRKLDFEACLTQLDPNAASDCIDERLIVNPETGAIEKNPIFQGYDVAGGLAGTLTIAGGIMRDIQSDEYFIAQANTLFPGENGGHISRDCFGDKDHFLSSQSHGKTGCGALDHTNDILAALWSHSAEVGEAIKKCLTLAGQDSSFDQKIFDSLFADRTPPSIPDHKPATFITSLLIRDQKGTIDIVDSGDPTSHDKFHGHKGKLVVANFRPGTSFDKVKFFEQHRNPKLQAFSLDLHRLPGIAKKRHPNNKDQEIKYLHSLWASQFGTLRALIAGDQKLVVIK